MIDHSVGNTRGLSAYAFGAMGGTLTPRQPMPEVPGVSHIYVNAGGLRTHVAVAGPEDGDPVLLLHGWPQHWWLWRNVIPPLAEAGYRVHAPDLRGFGWTEATPRFADYDRRHMANDIFALIEELELDRPIRLAGHDWGGWISFLITMRRPELFERYFALNIPPVWGDPGPFKLGQRLRTLSKLAYQLPLSTPGVSRQVQAGALRSRFAMGVVKASKRREVWENGVLDVFLDQFKDPARSRATMCLYRRFLTHELLPIATGSYAPGRLTVPTRLLFGMDDVAVDPSVVLADHSKKADDLTVETIDDCGHFIVDEQPELVADRMLAWFAGDREPAAASSA